MNGLTPPKILPAVFHRAQQCCSLLSASWVKHELVLLYPQSYPQAKHRSWNYSTVHVTSGRGPITTGGAGTLLDPLSALLLNAECRKPIPQRLNTWAGDEPFSRISFKCCAVQLLHCFEKEIIPLLTFSAPIPSHPIIRWAAWICSFEKGASDHLIFKEGPRFYFWSFLFMVEVYFYFCIC